MPPENGRAPPGGSGAPSENHCKSQAQRPKHNSDARSLQVLASLRLTAVRIVTEDDGTYSVDPRGRLAALIPVRDRWGEIVDAVAFFPEEPEQWWLRYGDETPILGAEALAYAAWEHQPLMLWETPLQWLLQHRSGSVVLDWGVDLRTIFEDIPTVACQSTALSDRLRQNFLKFGPRLTVRTGAARQSQGVRVA